MILKNKKYLIAIFVLVLTLLLNACAFTEKEESTDISDYNLYFGSQGKHHKSYLIENDIFPETIPSTANVEKFHYLYYNPFDPNYVCYLTYTCDDDQYKNEKDRLSKI